MGWILLDASKSFPQHACQWDDLNRSDGNHILLDSFFVEASIRHFGRGDVVLAVYSNANVPVMMVLLERGKWNFWQTFQPSQAPLGMILSRHEDDIEGYLQELIRLLPGYAVGIGVLQQDPDFTAFKRSGQFSQAQVLDYIQTARLVLVGSFEEYWRSRGKNLKHNLERQRRRLEKNGDIVEVVVENNPGNVSFLMEEYGNLEGTGWKGQVGTAVSLKNAQGQFYKEIFETAFQRGEGAIYRLKINGKTTACDLCLERNGMMVVLKTAYEESVPGISPSLLMRQEIVELLYRQNRIKVVEFYGRVRNWHLKWTDDIRVMYHLNFYRNRLIAEAHRMYSRLHLYTRTDA